MAKSIIQDDIIEYEKETAEVAAIIIGEIRDGIKERVTSYAQQFSLKMVLKIFENIGEEAVTAEFNQLCNQKFFEPILFKDLS